MLISGQMAYIATCVIAAGTPGPGTLAVINSSIISGFKKTLPLMIGIICGMAVIAVLTMFGLSMIILNSEVAFKIVQYLGGGYIIYLGCKSFESSRNVVADDIFIGDNVKFSFKSGLALSIINPKTIIFFTSLLPLFIDSNNSLLTQNIYLTVVLLLCTFAVHFIYANLGSYVSPFVKKNMKMIEIVTGVLFIVIAVFILIGVHRGG